MPEDMPKNIILLSIDCLRYDHCGFSGYHRNTTPFLDTLAEESYVFDQAIAPGTWTSESVPSMLTGRQSGDLAYYDNIRLKAIPSDADTIASQMGRLGYETIATVSNSQLSTERNFDLGFDSFSNPDLDSAVEDSEGTKGESDSILGRLQSLAKDRIGTNKVVYELNRRNSLLNMYTLPALANQVTGYRSGWPYTRAEPVLSEFHSTIEDRSKPRMFGWTHLMDLHAPLHPESIKHGGLCDSPRYRQLLDDVNRIANNDAPVYTDMYDSSLRYVDDQIRAFVDRLKESGEWSDTALLVTSDHGEALGEKGVYGHWSHYPYDGLIRVPLIVRPPGGTDPTRLDHVFSLAWLYELLAEMTESAQPKLPEQSSVNNHLDHQPKETIAVTDSLRDWGHFVIVRSDNWKLARNYHARGPINEEERYSIIKQIGATEVDSLDEQIESLNVGFDLSNDLSESYSLDVSVVPNSLSSLSKSHKTDPDTLPEIGDGMKSEIRSNLEDLGYL